MQEYRNTGLICVKNQYNIEFVVCKLEYILYEDETYKYIFTPYYDVIDLLDSSIFQGIPGLNLDLRKKEYIRENIVPVFISERVPQPNRENLYELLEEVGLTYIEPIIYLQRTKLQYFGDNFYMIEYKERETIYIDNNNQANTFGITKTILDNIACGNKIILDNQEVPSDIFHTLMFLYKKSYNLHKEKQQLGINQAKEEHKYKGRKPIEVDIIKFYEEVDKVNKHQINAKQAASNLGISIDKYYRLKKKHNI